MALICPNCNSQEVIENVSTLHCLACGTHYTPETLKPTPKKAVKK